ncbi:MAG: sigma-54 dependent transcriptional regulator [Planctomycetota bacterium]
MSEANRRILIADADRIVAKNIASFLERDGCDVVVVPGGADAIDAITAARSGDAHHPPQPFAVLIADLRLPDINGQELIRKVREIDRSIMFIAVTGFGTIEDAVSTVRFGAIDYLTKPLIEDELRLSVDKAIHQHALIAENSQLRQQLDERYALDSVVGQDDRMRRIFDVVHAVAPSKTTVLMCGESGTGKSMIARAVHRLSPRADAPFVEISCGSIPETLLESELFGHVRGAFTGAHADKKGRFLAAHGGTIFLDEINSASAGMQLKLLRVLQERVLEPVGSDAPVEVDVRVILASNQPLEDLVARGDFRQDLYYRINVVTIDLPPLRDRTADVVLLATHFLEEKSAEIGKQITGFSDEALQCLRAYPFPGNVRELENVVERAVVLTTATRIGVQDLPEQVINAPRSSRSATAGQLQLADYTPMPLREALQEPEKQIILAALQANDWNRQRTAEVLDINRTTLYKKIKQYELERYGQAG